MESRTTTARRCEVLAVNPDTLECDMPILIPSHRIQWARRMGLGAVTELAGSVVEALRNPIHLYRGIKRDSDDPKGGDHPGWLCYVDKPKRRYDYQTGKERSPDDRILMVYVNEGRIMYHHRWEMECNIVPGRPEDLDNRFMEILI